MYKDYTHYGYIDDGPDFINHRLSGWRKTKQKMIKLKYFNFMAILIYGNSYHNDAVWDQKKDPTFPPVHCLVAAANPCQCGFCWIFDF